MGAQFGLRVSLSVASLPVINATFVCCGLPCVSFLSRFLSAYPPLSRGCSLLSSTTAFQRQRGSPTFSSSNAAAPHGEAEFSLVCPVADCRRRHQLGIAGLETLRPVEGASLSGAGRTEPEPTCGNACGRVATLFCAECCITGIVLCEACFNSVHSQPALRSHQRAPASAAYETCAVHLCTKRLMCMDCGALACNTCIVSTHEGHRLVPLPKALAALNSELAGLGRSLEADVAHAERLSKALSDRASTIDAEVKSAQAELDALLNGFKAKIEDIRQRISRNIRAAGLSIKLRATGAERLHSRARELIQSSQSPPQVPTEGETALAQRSIRKVLTLQESIRETQRVLRGALDGVDSTVPHFDLNTAAVLRELLSSITLHLPRPFRAPPSPVQAPAPARATAPPPPAAAIPAQVSPALAEASASVPAAQLAETEPQDEPSQATGAAEPSALPATEPQTQADDSGRRPSSVLALSPLPQPQGADSEERAADASQIPVSPSSPAPSEQPGGLVSYPMSMVRAVHAHYAPRTADRVHAHTRRASELMSVWRAASER